LKQKFCIICKEVVNPRYRITITDTKRNTDIRDFVCTDCYERLFMSHHNNGIFGVSRFFSWLRKGQKDLRRL